MSCCLAARKRGVSTYLELFLLIGIAVGGSGMVLDASLSLVSPSQGASVDILGASVRQGAYAAFESITVSDVGQKPIISMTVSTQPVSATAIYCYSVVNPTSMAVLKSTCPAMTSGPGSVGVTSGVAPGQSVLLQLVIIGQAFALGSSSTITVTGADGSQGSTIVEVVPA